MADQQNSEKRITIYCQWRGYNIRDFIKRVHIRYTDKDKADQTEDEMVQQLFDENKDYIYTQMSETDKEDYAFWKQKNSYPTREDRSRDKIEDFENTIKDNLPKSGDDLDKEMRLPYPCKLTIEAHCINAELMISQTNFQYQADNVWAFADEHIQEVLEEDSVGDNGYSKSEPGITVFIWSKQLAQPSARMAFGNGLGSMTNHKTLGWMDLSDFVMSMNSNVGSNGGTFSMKLPYIPVEKSRSQWLEVGTEKYTGEGAYVDIKRYTSPKYEKSPLGKTASGSWYIKTEYSSACEKNSFFHTFIQSNDLLFISFSEKLVESEKEDLVGEGYKDKDYFNYFKSSHAISKIAGANSFDMIVLIDNITLSKGADGTYATIDISGRDLSKLLIDDGTYYFSHSTTYQPQSVFFNEQGYGKQGDVVDVEALGATGQFFLGWQPYASINRVRNLDTLDIFRNLTNQSIDFVIKGVLSRLANIEIVPSNTFEYWDNRTRWLDIHPDAELEKGTNDRTSTEREEVEEKEDLDKVYGEDDNNTETTTENE